MPGTKDYGRDEALRNPLNTAWEVRAAMQIAGALTEVDSPRAAELFSDYRTHAINLCHALASLTSSPTTPEVEEALASVANGAAGIKRFINRHDYGPETTLRNALSQPQAQPQEVPDRIDFICEPWVDDAVLSATSVHIEDLGEKVWIGVNRADGDRFCFEVGPSADSPIGVCLTEGSVGSLATLSTDTPVEEER